MATFTLQLRPGLAFVDLTSNGRSSVQVDVDKELLWSEKDLFMLAEVVHSAARIMRRGRVEHLREEQTRLRRAIRSSATALVETPAPPPPTRVGAIEDHLTARQRPRAEREREKRQSNVETSETEPPY